MDDDTPLVVYKPFIVRINNELVEKDEPTLILERNSQIMIQFLWKSAKSASRSMDKFLVFIHKENILLYTNTFSETETIDPQLLKKEIIVKSFTWAQWDPNLQSLYYIHLKLVTKNLLEKEENRQTESTPTLSAYQFHDDLPTETVVS